MRGLIDRLDKITITTKLENKAGANSASVLVVKFGEYKSWKMSYRLRRVRSLFLCSTIFLEALGNGVFAVNWGLFKNVGCSSTEELRRYLYKRGSASI